MMNYKVYVNGMYVGTQEMTKADAKRAEADKTITVKEVVR